MRIESKEYVNSCRQKLLEILPVSAPIVVNISLHDICNFRCNYCVHGNEMPPYLTNEQMALEKFKLLIDKLSKLGRIKCIHLCGYGEPLLYPYICEAVEYIHQKNFVDVVQIVSNGSMLTNELSDKLLEAGLNRLKISLQGVAENQYTENCNVKIDFKKSLNNFEYFHEKEKKYNCTIIGKIMSNTIPENMTDEDIHKEFGRCFDDIIIEHLAPFNGIENNDISEYDSTVLGYQMKPVKICNLPFYFLYISPIGNAYPCCTLPISDITTYGNVFTNNIEDIWMGKKHLKLMIDLLSHNKMVDFPFCNGCHDFQYVTKPADNIDDFHNDLLRKYKKIAAEKYKM